MFQQANAALPTSLLLRLSDSTGGLTGSSKAGFWLKHMQQHPHNLLIGLLGKAQHWQKLFAVRNPITGGQAALNEPSGRSLLCPTGQRDCRQCINDMAMIFHGMVWKHPSKV